MTDQPSDQQRYTRVHSRVTLQKMQPNDVLTNFDRSRPVVNLEAEVRFLAEGGSIDMEQRDCQTRQGEDVACSKIRLCTRYSGLGVEQKLSKLGRRKK